MSIRQPSIWLGRPPTGTGAQLSGVRPAKRLPWSAWFEGRIVRFCATADEALVAVEYEKAEAR